MMQCPGVAGVVYALRSLVKQFPANDWNIFRGFDRQAKVAIFAFDYGNDNFLVNDYVLSGFPSDDKHPNLSL